MRSSRTARSRRCSTGTPSRSGAPAARRRDGPPRAAGAGSARRPRAPRRASRPGAAVSATAGKASPSWSAKVGPRSMASRGASAAYRSTYGAQQVGLLEVPQARRHGLELAVRQVRVPGQSLPRGGLRRRGRDRGQRPGRAEVRRRWCRRPRAAPRWRRPRGGPAPRAGAPPASAASGRPCRSSRAAGRRRWSRRPGSASAPPPARRRRSRRAPRRRTAASDASAAVALVGRHEQREQADPRPSEHPGDDRRHRLGREVSGHQVEERRRRRARRSTPGRTRSSRAGPGWPARAPPRAPRTPPSTTARRGAPGRRSPRPRWARPPPRPGAGPARRRRRRRSSPGSASDASYVATRSRCARLPSRTRTGPSSSRVTRSVSKPVRRSHPSTQPRTSRSEASSRAATKSSSVALPHRCRDR